MNICLTFTPFETTTHGLPILTSNSPPQASIVTKELGTPTVFYEGVVVQRHEQRRARGTSGARVVLETDCLLRREGRWLAAGVFQKPLGYGVKFIESWTVLD
ncbi:Dihydroorotase [Gossypium arboreum]|uniref:Dihydroorotase n=1 Tax=Gossypium arboreum TaxID=29729 RepID=A0A0B0MEK1_GOSAR|nr:Dihydroorotase [Gossypium arboreum]